jgi:hypothetical protein
MSHVDQDVNVVQEHQHHVNQIIDSIDHQINPFDALTDLTPDHASLEALHEVESEHHDPEDAMLQ